MPATGQGGDAGTPVSRISRAYPDRVEVRGRDLAGDLMGRLSFTEYFHLLLTGREPSEDERFFLDLLLVAIAEHGLMPTNVAARMTLAADPASLHGAVAAGILGAGPVVLGTSEECARLLEEMVAAGREPAEVARSVRAAGGKVPGFGHPVHRPVDPRAERILELADARGVSGRHVGLAWLHASARCGRGGRVRALTSRRGRGRSSSRSTTRATARSSRTSSSARRSTARSWPRPGSPTPRRPAGWRTSRSSR
jgi:hypothetical protein